MKRLLTITSLLLILMAYVERLEGSMEEDEVYECFIQVLCFHDKVKEIYELTTVAGDENAKRYIEELTKASGIKFPENSLENCYHFKEVICKMPEDERKKMFMDWSASVGEYVLDICQSRKALLCMKADIAAAEFANFLAKYKAMGVCQRGEEVLTEMVPGSTKKKGSLPIG
ncbi:unnamed protein product [Larinioides sclopetarius]|uniref:Uncharacterized protein n=1 Tax=Larinioides sclopetarius TaxID=280406 RepID=A0AAV2A911_9ARAC